MSVLGIDQITYVAEDLPVSAYLAMAKAYAKR